MNYPINEIFYSLQGEGRWTGTPSCFIRLYGCNLSCAFCDTPNEKTDDLDPEDIVDRVIRITEPSIIQHVVITGGEPTIHDLQPLILELQDNGFTTHVETNGNLTEFSHTAYSAEWITISPKGKRLDPGLIHVANEIKFLCGPTNWEEYIYWFGDKYSQLLKNTHKYLMPLDENNRERTEKNHLEAIKYCKSNPSFSLCLQTHKLLKIK